MRVHTILYDIVDFLSFTVFIFGVILFVRFFVINPFTVMGASMEPTFHQGDFILVNKYERFVGKKINRGDVVVIVPPVSNGVPYIKRVIGLPGDTVTLSGDHVYLGSGDAITLLDESAYLSDDVKTEPKFDKSVFPVPEGEYFVLGDNREHSTDSRSCFDMCIGDATPTVTQKDVVGVVGVRLRKPFSLKNQR